jgi:hypothetical protein
VEVLFSLITEVMDGALGATHGGGRGGHGLPIQVDQLDGAAIVIGKVRV